MARRHPEVTEELAEPENVYGTGSITLEKGRYRLRLRKAGQDKSFYYDTEEQARDMRAAFFAARDAEEGITLREWGEIWLDEYDFSKSIRDTWRSIVLRAPFIDYPVRTITPDHISEWATSLLTLPASRSVLKRGVRKTVLLDHPISRAYGKQALSGVRVCLEAAKNRAPRLIDTNPAENVSMPKPRGANGRLRTKKVKRTRAGQLDYLPQPDCERVFFCEECERASGTPRYDLEQLVQCEHVPFFYRVAMSVSVMQGLRQGEIASQRWERIRWSDTSDWTGHVWLVATSWDGDTKNGQDRWQALIPMAARLLHRWWQVKGSPKEGLLFCKADATPKRKLGELALFVARHPKLTNQALLDEARRQGVALTRRKLEVLRSEARKRAERKRSQQDKMFARGYDFGWSSTPYCDENDNLLVRPGWCDKLELSVRTRFHDFRDTAATHLLSGTWGPVWSLQMVSAWLGHSDIEVTQDRYAHLTHEAKTQAAAAVNPARFVAAPMPSTSPNTPITWPAQGGAERHGAKRDSGQIARTLPSDARDADPLSGWNHLAPEAGLEPAATRLTEDGLAADSLGKSDFSGNVSEKPGTNTPIFPSTNLGHPAPQSGDTSSHDSGAQIEPRQGAGLVVDDATIEAAKRVLAAAAGGSSLLKNALELAGSILEAAEKNASETPIRPAEPRLQLVRNR